MDKTMRAEVEGPPSHDTRMQFEKGWLWEETLSLAFGQKAAIRVGEVELQGIVGSPDGVNFDMKGAFIEEYKCTSMSPDKTPADVWRWLAQVKAYCKMMGTNRCVFRVLHMTFVPTYRPWELIFTQQEIDENWDAMLNSAAARQKGTDSE